MNTIQTMNIKIAEIIGKEIAVNSTDAEQVYKKIDEQFSNKEEVELDFSGISIINTAFLNTAVGQLFSKYTKEQISELLKLKKESLSSGDLVLFSKVIARAISYFADKEKFNRSLDNIL